MNPLTADDSLTLSNALAQAAHPADVYRAVQQVLAARLGFGLFTLLVLTPDGQEVQRVYSTNVQAYPLAGSKRMGPTPWGDLVLTRRQGFVGCDAAAIRWAFPDHELIASLGLGCAINVPIVAMGRVLGTMNLLDAPGRYKSDDIEIVQSVAPILVAPFLRELKGF